MPRRITLLCCASHLTGRRRDAADFPSLFPTIAHECTLLPTATAAPAESSANSSADSSANSSADCDVPRTVSLDAAAARIWARYADVMKREGVGADALQVRRRCGPFRVFWDLIPPSDDS